MKRIEIAGGIASGKSTLACCIADSSTNLLCENFQDYPFWEKFYEDPTRYAFETEITFLLQHYHLLAAQNDSNRVAICDYSFILDRSYIDVTLDKNAKRVFIVVFDEVCRRLREPDLLVHLVCDPVIELERIRARGRSQEVSISVEFLSDLNHAVRQHVKESGAGNIVVIDSGARDFATDEQTRESLRAELLSLLVPQST